MTSVRCARTPRVFDLALPELPLEAGARVASHLVRGWWWGPSEDLPWLESRSLLHSEESGTRPMRVVQRTAERLRHLSGEARRTSSLRAVEDVPTVLLVHALTGDARAGGPGGWWEPVIGPGRVLDPGRVRLLCFNNLGSCYGTSGPADAGFPRRVDDSRFGPPSPLPKGNVAMDETLLPATVTPWDQARSILLALDALGVERVSLVVGGSLGGMIVQCLAALAPERFERMAPIAAAEAASPWVLGWNHVARQAVLLDPGYPKAPWRGLELARQLATLTYRAEPGLALTQGREGAAGWSSRALYPVQSYLEHQGSKLRARFDARAYLALLGAMDHHDLARARGLERIQASTLAVGIDRDQLFFPEHMKSLASRLRALGRHAEYAELSSPHGHDGFLIEWAPVAELLQRALALPSGLAPRHPAIPLPPLSPSSDIRPVRLP